MESCELSQNSEIDLTASYPPRFDLSDEKNVEEMLAYLDEHGYCVVARS